LELVAEGLKFGVVRLEFGKSLNHVGPDATAGPKILGELSLILYCAID
jgi:hypothetical protein